MASVCINIPLVLNFEVLVWLSIGVSCNNENDTDIFKFVAINDDVVHLYALGVTVRPDSISEQGKYVLTQSSQA